MIGIIAALLLYGIYDGRTRDSLDDLDRRVTALELGLRALRDERPLRIITSERG